MTDGQYFQLKVFIEKFISLSDSEWEFHSKRLVARAVKKGEYLLTSNEICSHVWFVNSGAFRSFSIVNEEERTDFFALENEYVTNYESFLTRQPSQNFIQALENSEVLQLAYDDMQHCYQQIPAWQKFGRLIAEYIYIGVAQRASDLLLKKPEELYLNILKDPRKLAERVPQHLIASYLGIKPESLSRIRSRMATPNRP